MKRTKEHARPARVSSRVRAASTTTHDEAPETARRRVRAPWTLALIGAASLVAVLATSDRGRSASDPLEECEDYATTLQRCFGESAVRAPAPPKTKEARSAAAKQCSEDRARIERACR